MVTSAIVVCRFVVMFSYLIANETQGRVVGMLNYTHNRVVEGDDVLKYISEKESSRQPTGSRDDLFFTYRWILAIIILLRRLRCGSSY